MAHIRKVGAKELYWCLDAGCLGRTCLALGTYQHRGATLAGSKNSGESLRCLTNAYRGCPDTERPVDRALAATRRKEGYRVQG
jgi:hypothetical protein